MAGKEENRIFVGGLSWDATERELENAFDRYGKVIECQIMLERDTGRPRGFGFITFADRRGMEDAIREMHGREFGDRVISVNKAQPKMGGEDLDHGYRGGGYSSGGRGSYGGGDRSTGQDDCFKCGRPGIGPGIALQQVEVHILHVLGLEGLVAVVIALGEIVTGMLMIVMMEVATEIGTVLTAETTNMGAVIAMLLTGTHLVEIVLQVIGMVVQIVTPRMVLAKTKATIKMVAHEGAAIGM